MEYRMLGTSGIEVSVIGMGCWPMAGVGWTGIDDDQSLAALKTAIDQGITLIDTAYMYGQNGESERLVAKAIAECREQIVLATKCGLHWEGDLMIRDSSRSQILKEFEESLRRLNTDYVDLYQVHAFDEKTPIQETAETLAELLSEGKIRAIGVSNYDSDQMKEFARYAPLHSNQPPYNILMREIELDLLPHCQAENVGVVTYWPLYRGLLTGKYGRGHKFPDGDSRIDNPHFNGSSLDATLEMLEQIRPIAEACNKSVAQTVINWTANQPGITAALCGATRPEHVAQNVEAVGWHLSEAQMQSIAGAAKARTEK